MQYLLLLSGGQRLTRFVPSETAIMRGRDRYYAAIRQSRSLESLRPILEFLAECFAVSAEKVVEEGRKLLRESAGNTPEARHRKILAHAKKQDDFSIQDAIAWMPDVHAAYWNEMWLKNWYPRSAFSLPAHVGRIICQRANVV